ncbi:uncharacterized protein B0T15DRAFT_515041 [Chaetomium strumarium]|uniref:Uncharacterized protein n=1 Tax=Chaetomium strumarium TaxID=1170767 RepID=A0AAJ0GKV3_9PEZI|nr:hypothetical protein B0T15DRAFT_515041 [Chaetomium strumarium]
MASTRFASLPEMLHCLAEQITSSRELLTLCLVNGAFRDVFLPALYRKVTIVPPGTEFAVSSFAEECCVQYTRHLTIACDPSPAETGNDETGRTILRKLLPNMPGLQSFTDLMLINIYGDLSCWRTEIARLLRNVPALRALQLSLHPLVIKRRTPGDETEINAFFDRLCREYQGTGAAPLRLRTLHLGQGMCPKQPGWLARLTDPGVLEAVDIDNSGYAAQEMMLGIQWPDTPWLAPPWRPLIDFSAIKDCPRLRRFSVAEYTWDVHQVLASLPDPSTTRQLAVSCGDMWTTGQEPAALLRPDPRYPSLPLRLRSMDINLRRCPSAEAVLQDLVAVDDGTLEGLTVWFDDTNWFDDTDGYNPSYSKTVDVDQIEHMALFLDALPKLRNLTELAVELAVLESPTRNPSPWEYSYFDPSMRPHEDFETLAAKLADAAGPRLRYIDLRAAARLVRWRVWRDPDGTVARLELLDNDSREVEEVEIFWEPAGGRRHSGDQWDG